MWSLVYKPNLLQSPVEAWRESSRTCRIKCRGYIHQNARLVWLSKAHISVVGRGTPDTHKKNDRQTPERLIPQESVSDRRDYEPYLEVLMKQTIRATCTKWPDARKDILQIRTCMGHSASARHKWETGENQFSPRVTIISGNISKTCSEVISKVDNTIRYLSGRYTRWTCLFFILVSDDFSRNFTRKRRRTKSRFEKKGEESKYHHYKACYGSTQIKPKLESSVMTYASSKAEASFSLCPWLCKPTQW